MENNLKLLKVEYFNNHWSDLTQILNLSSGDHTKIKNVEMKTTIMEDDLKILKVEYLIKHWSSSDFKLKLRRLNQIKHYWNVDNLK